MPGFEDLLAEGGAMGRQLFVWAVLAEIVNTLTEPYQRALEQDVNAHDPNDVLSPADLAQAVVRAVMSHGDASTIAARSGLSADNFTTLLHLAAGPPGLETVLAMHRRGIIQWGEAGPTKANAANAIATARLYSYWAPYLRKLNIQPIPAAEMVDAMVENQTTRGTRGLVETMAGGETVTGLTPNATTFYEVMWANGYTPEQADLMYNTRGNPPAPTQLLELFRRGAIGWTGVGPAETTVQQGIHEGATKDKWTTLYKALVTEIPSEYYIMEMLKNGSITATLATTKLLEFGYTAEIAGGIVSAAQGGAVDTYKKLTESIITKLYSDRVLSRTQAKTMLVDIGYADVSATFVLDTIDLATQTKAVDSAVTRVGNLYRARKLTRTQAQQALSALGITGTAVTQLLTTLTLERSVTVRVLTEAQIVDAWDDTIIGAPEALASLEALGYTPRDAWVLLSIKAKGPLPTEPPPGPAAVTAGA